MTDGERAEGVRAEEALLRALRRNGRAKLTDISRETGVPVSTLHQKLHDKRTPITRHAALLDFARMGYAVQANVGVTVPESGRAHLRSLIFNHPLVNTAHETIDGFILEIVCREAGELHETVEALNEAGGQTVVRPLVSTLVREGVGGAEVAARRRQIIT